MVRRRAGVHRGWMTRIRIVDAVVLGLLTVGMVALSTRFPAAWWGQDAWAYWAIDPGHPYALPWGQVGAFLYAPPIAQVAGLFRSLPWGTFMVAWTALLGVALWWMGRGRAAALFLVPAVALEVLYGNVHLLIAAAVVLGFRWPGTWSLVLLTKVTPGVGLLWFVARREWRSLAIAFATTTLIVGVSFVLAPGTWSEWIDRLRASSNQGSYWLDSIFGPMWFRIGLAALIAFGGGLTGYRWPVAVATTLAMPILWFASLSTLVALVPLIAMDRRDPLPAMVRLPRLRPSREAITAGADPRPTGN
jgi:hypothetical protein